MRERAVRGEPMPVYRPPAQTPSRKSTTMSTVGSASIDPSNASTTSLPLTTTEIEDELIRIDSNSETGAVGTSASKDGGGKRKVDWGGMRDQALAHAQTGTQWWQTGKDLWKGEKKVQFSWKGVREDWENVSPSLKLSLGFLSLNTYCRWRSLLWPRNKYLWVQMDPVCISPYIQRKSHLHTLKRAFVSLPRSCYSRLA